MATWQEYRRQAQLFWEVAESVNDGQHPNQAASNAILAAIAANDALCLRIGGRHSRSGDHASAIGLLLQLTRGKRHAKEATARAEQLAAVVELKNEAQYLGRPLTPAKAGRVMTQTRRFIEWVETILSSPDADE